MDFMANRANFYYYWQEFKQLESKMKKSTNFFAVSEFKFPKFESMAREIDVIDEIGKITDNSDFSKLDATTRRWESSVHLKHSIFQQESGF